MAFTGYGVTEASAATAASSARGARPRAAGSWWRRGIDWLAAGARERAAPVDAQPAPPSTRDAAYFDGVAALACSGCFHIGEGGGAGTPFDHTPV
ncbi:MAG: hypothetical protein ACRYG5_01695 [Janthinobacterium lividum]